MSTASTLAAALTSVAAATASPDWWSPSSAPGSTQRSAQESRSTSPPASTVARSPTSTFEADRYPEASKLLAAALVIDLAALAAEKQRSGGAGVVLIDVIGALAADHVSRLFARPRGAGLSLLLGTQSLADLRAARPDDVSDTPTEQVFSNVAYAVVHRVGHPDAAETLARTEPAWTRTEQMGGGLLAAPHGGATRTRQRDFIVGVDQFKSLATGQAVVVNPRAGRRAEVVAIWPAERGEA